MVTPLCGGQAPGSKYGIVVSPEVARALRERQPVVALESTIISHGMPYPQNLETAQQVEAIVREGARACSKTHMCQANPLPRTNCLSRVPRQ